MSADNWAVCPKCVEKAKESLIWMKENAKQAYGKVFPEDYELLLDAIKKRIRKDAYGTA